MTRSLKQVLLATLLTGLICCGSWVLPSTSEACCIYNHSKYVLSVSMGWHLTYDIGPGEKHCPYGVGGSAMLELKDPKSGKFVGSYVKIDVDHHGWISVYKKSDHNWQVVSKRKNGSVKDVQYMEPF